MIRQFSIGNFKAFGDGQQNVPLKPLTIIFGPNSSGKSTILHSLLFAHHAARTGDLDVVYPELAEATVDLGGFRQFIHGAEFGIESRLSWGAECFASDLATHLDNRRSDSKRQLGGPESNVWPMMMADITVLEINLAVGIPRDDKGKPLPTARPRVERMECLADKKLILSGFSIDGNNLQIDQVASDHPLISRMTSALAEAGTFVLDLSNAMRDRITKEIDSLVADLQVETDGILPKKLYDVKAKRRVATESETRWPELGSVESIAKVIRSILPGMLNELLVGIAELIRKDLFTIKYLGPLRSYPPRHIAFAEARNLGSSADGGRAWLELVRDADVRQKSNQWLLKLATPYELRLQHYVEETAVESIVRRLVKKLYPNGVVKGMSVRDLEGPEWGRAWNIYREFIDPDMEAHRLDQKLQELEEVVGELVECDSLLDAQWDESQRLIRSESPCDVALVDKRTGTIVSHRDVGIGISQVLPVLVAAYGSKNRIVAIEQPEIHLHPALQSELGDVFIESALGESANRFVLETHSEHLILRILRRIREASRHPEPSITPADVCVLYVHPQKTGSQVMEMRISKDGQFLDPWPGGFFAERLREMLGA
jgi:hypothetical protein